jgi:hypothetical protein
LCRRVHYLRAKGWIDAIQWKEWDGWIEDLVTSKTFRGVHVDSNEQSPTDFGKHIDSHIIKLRNKKQRDFDEKYINDYLKDKPGHCECEVCKKFGKRGNQNVAKTEPL